MEFILFEHSLAKRTFFHNLYLMAPFNEMHISFL